jgi:hypothetical protein
MISISIFSKIGNSDSLEASYCWPQGAMPAGQLVGRAGNALLMQMSEKDRVAVISAPIADVIFAGNGLPIVNLNWAFK